MHTCHRAETWSSKLGLQQSLGFKVQKVVDQWHQAIAEEILYNGELPAIPRPADFFTSQSFIDALLSHTEMRALQTHIPRLFINIEPESLCDISSLAKLAYLHRQLKSYHCELTVEITERINCENCDVANSGLLRLRHQGLSIALDDYDIYNETGDKRRFNPALFNIIKIIRPSNSRQIFQFGKFFQQSPLRPEQMLVVENIERLSELKQVLNTKGLPKRCYFQGYLFHRPQALEFTLPQLL